MGDRPAPLSVDLKAVWLTRLWQVRSDLAWPRGPARPRRGPSSYDIASWQKSVSLYSSVQISSIV
ncbi:hypothetical protein GCM10022402_06050 [Salinactinospora qingdaonensis]|uniref:Uncharacterized protein n=1 Tax=Salinactinospora qingdaonensis TaxID=702744 RepID=A0ABP7EZ11_9ACTN